MFSYNLMQGCIYHLEEDFFCSFASFDWLNLCMNFNFFIIIILHIELCLAYGFKSLSFFWQISSNDYFSLFLNFQYSLPDWLKIGLRGAPWATFSNINTQSIIVCFVFSELVDGSVGANLLVDGSTVTLLPRAETGLIVSIYFSHNRVHNHCPMVKKFFLVRLNS